MGKVRIRIIEKANKAKEKKKKRDALEKKDKEAKHKNNELSGKKAKQEKAKKPKKTDGCNGWSPSSGKYAGQGHKCAKFNWSRAWCYVDKGFKGPGHEFMRASKAYKEKYYMP